MIANKKKRTAPGDISEVAILVPYLRLFLGKAMNAEMSTNAP